VKVRELLPETRKIGRFPIGTFKSVSTLTVTECTRSVEDLTAIFAMIQEGHEVEDPQFAANAAKTIVNSQAGSEDVHVQAINDWMGMASDQPVTIYTGFLRKGLPLQSYSKDGIETINPTRSGGSWILRV